MKADICRHNWKFTFQAAEILLEHGANPNQKDQKQRTALEEADDEKMKELLKSYGAVETSSGDEMGSAVTGMHVSITSYFRPVYSSA